MRRWMSLLMCMVVARMFCVPGVFGQGTNKYQTILEITNEMTKLDRINPYFGVFNVDNDSQKEIIFVWSGIQIVDPLTGEIDDIDVILGDKIIAFGKEQENSIKSCFIEDIDNDGIYEFIIEVREGHVGYSDESRSWKVLKYQGNGSNITRVEDEANQPVAKYALYNNFPNPFNPTTNIIYDVQKEGRVVLKIYNIEGQAVKTLVDEDIPVGTHSIIWDGKDDFGNKAATGVYLYELQVGDFTSSKKMLLLR